MTNNQDSTPWLRPLLHKRSPDAIRILCDLLEAGLRKGEASANDIREIKLEQVNVIGAIFKILPRFGFLHTERRVKTTRERKHGRRVDVWELSDRSKAEQALAPMRIVLMQSANQQPVQQEML